MRVVLLVLAVISATTPSVVYVGLVRKLRRRQLASAWLSLGAGLVAYAIWAWIQRSVARWVGTETDSATASELASSLYGFLVAAPLEQGLLLASTVALLRRREEKRALDSMVITTGLALAFAGTHAISALRSPIDGPTLLRAAMTPAVHVFASLGWAYVLGRSRDGRASGRMFNAAWLAGVAVIGLSSYLLGTGRPAGLLATAALTVFTGAAAGIAGFDLSKREAVRGPLVERLAIAAPSLAAVEDALRQAERPVMWRWIGFGALVTTGLVTTALVLAVVVGRRFGVDFAAIDRADGAGSTTAPLALLASGTLAAFPCAGFLIGKAAGARTVLEPALSAGLSIATTLVFVGLAAPVAVVFALAFAPIAFGLACAGAWLGLTR